MASGLLDRIALVRGGSDGAAARLADVVLSDPARAAELTIGALAERAGTSPATVTRLCRRLGLSGYGALRRGLAVEASRVDTSWQSDVSNRIESDDPLEKVITVLAAAEVRAVQETVGRLDVTALEAACAALAGARRIDLCGVGGSATVAAELQPRLHRIGRASWVWPDVHSAITSAALLGEQDVAVAVSDTGMTRETSEPLAVARARGATTIAVTADPGSDVVSAADILLRTATSAVALRPSAIAARHSQLLVLDCLYVGVAQRTYDRTAVSLTSTAAAVEAHRGGRSSRPSRRASSDR